MNSAGVLLENTKSSPAAATLNISTASNQFSALNSIGNNSAVNFSGSGVQLIIGETSNANSALNNLNSTLSSVITETSSSAVGALTKDGSGLLDISGGSLALSNSSTVVVNGGALRIGNGVVPTSGGGSSTVFTINSGAELQYSGNGGSLFTDAIQGSGDFNLLGGTVKFTGTNTYGGGTNIQIGATLDVTTANLPTGGAISNAGGTWCSIKARRGLFPVSWATAHRLADPAIPMTSPAL